MSDWAYKDWYCRHKEQLQERRRQKYQTDKRHREKQQARSRRYRRQKRKELVPAPLGHLSTKRPFSILLANGAKYTCWSVGVLDHLLGKRRGHVADREKRDAFPPTPIRGEQQVRYYTTEMIDVVTQGVEEIGWEPGLVRYVLVRWRVIPFWERIECGHFTRIPFFTTFPLVSGGPVIEFFGTEHVAAEVGRTESQVLVWEDKGVIPYTPFRLERERLYTAGMVEAIKQAIWRRGVLRASDATLPREIQEAWDKHLEELENEQG
jgi:hypothetical protein